MKTDNKIKVLIMAGGRGTRLWPESTSKKPKQYLSFLGEETLLEQTVDRFNDFIPVKDKYIVTTQEQRHLVEKYAGHNFNKDNILFEPEARDTAPCILLALAQLEKSGANNQTVIAVMPSDHVIFNKKSFKKSFEQAATLCSTTNTITTIGIMPTFPQTGYGYIHAKSEISANCYKVEQFKEKPDFTTAQKYLATGEYFWNAGMFMATLGKFKEEFQKHSPELYKFYELFLSAKSNEEITALYSKIEKISIDYALMERSNAISLVKSSFDWNDLGSWEAMQDIATHDQDNYILKSKGHYFQDAHNNIIFAPNKFVAVQGIENKVIAINDEAVLIIDKKQSQEVKSIVKFLKDKSRVELI